MASLNKSSLTKDSVLGPLRPGFDFQAGNLLKRTTFFKLKKKKYIVNKYNKKHILAN